MTPECLAISVLITLLAARMCYRVGHQDGSEKEGNMTQKPPECTVPEPRPMLSWSYAQLLDFLRAPQGFEALVLPAEWVYQIGSQPDTASLLECHKGKWSIRGSNMPIHPVFHPAFRYASPLSAEQSIWFQRAIQHHTDAWSALEYCKHIHPDASAQAD